MRTFNIFHILPLGVALLLAGCKGGEAIIQPEPVEERVLEEIVVQPDPEPTDEPYELPTYNPSYTRTNDLLHTQLDLRFDWDKQHVLGKAWLDFTPLFYPTNTLSLDAKGFDIHAIEMNGKKLEYDYKDEILTIALDKEYKAGEKYKVYIDYTAKPNERQFGGSSAITSEKGLFFINPLDNEGDKPQQIWTQGETENNSAWFPTVDKPNERTTQEITLTVQDRFKTLSNGLLTSSKKNADGTRTDVWTMDMGHTPYLFMLAIGEFAIVEEKWGDMLLQYYVEPKYEKHAKAIFNHTPEMLTFFSDFIGVKYPWQKYSQVVVRDYVSGAMENTTAVIFGDFVQRTDRELIDNHNDRIVAHELMHHWFGDLVTCESWANLTMNEGFANYSEYLWFEHKYGRDAADYHLMNEQTGYFASSQGNAHPLIYFGYNDKEDMFDAHSYNKGGAILHMLRNTVGDDAFRAALKKYLEDNEFTAVEAHDLRMAFEEVTGRDLNWFFNQWYFEQGHPKLDIEYGYDATKKEAIVRIAQVQDPTENPPIFILPMSVDVYTQDGKPAKRHNITMTQREQEFRLPANAKPKLIVADAEHYLLAQMSEERSEEERIFQYNNAPNFRDRYEAAQALKAASSEAAAKTLEKAMSDDFWAIRNMAVGSVALSDNPANLKKLEDMAKNDPHSQVKASAILLLARTGDAKYADIAKNAIDKERSYTVVAAGLEALTNLDKAAATEYAAKLEDSESGSMVAAVGKIYAESGDVSKMVFFEKNMDKMDGYAAINFVDSYTQLAVQGDLASILKAAENMNTVGMDMNQSPWRRYACTKAINDLYMAFKGNGDTDNSMKLKRYISDIKAAETNGQLKSLYSGFGM